MIYKAAAWQCDLYPAEQKKTIYIHFLCPVCTCGSLDLTMYGLDMFIQRETHLSTKLYSTFLCKHITTSSCIDFNSGMANHHSSCELNQSQLWYSFRLNYYWFILRRILSWFNFQALSHFVGQIAHLNILFLCGQCRTAFQFLQEKSEKINDDENPQADTPFLFRRAPGVWNTMFFFSHCIFKMRGKEWPMGYWVVYL